MTTISSDLPIRAEEPERKVKIRLEKLTKRYADQRRMPSSSWISTSMRARSSSSWGPPGAARPRP